MLPGDAENPNVTVPPAGTSLFHGNVDASKRMSAPSRPATLAFQMLAICRSITKASFQSRRGWLVLLRIETSPWNPVFQSFVTLNVTVAWGNSTVTFPAPGDGVGVGVGVG